MDLRCTGDDYWVVVCSDEWWVSDIRVVVTSSCTSAKVMTAVPAQMRHHLFNRPVVIVNPRSMAPPAAISMTMSSPHIQLVK